VTSVATNVGALPSALQRALAEFPEEVAERAGAALRVCLHERLTAADAREWSTSVLTGSGFPVELTFTTADHRLRYTVEPASWRDTPQRRLDVAMRLVSSMAEAAVPEDASRAWHHAQRRDGLRYGAWLGGRHGTGGDTGLQTDDEYKLYVELPAVGEAGIGSGISPGPRLPDRATTVRMVAYAPATQRYETYYRIPSLAPYHLPRVLAPCGLEPCSHELLSYVTEAYGHVLRERFPGASVGVSYSMQAGGEPQSVTLFLFARVFWGADARIRERFGSLARAMGWDDSRYQQITAALASHHTCTTHHGIFGVTLTRDKRLHLSIGVRPPEVNATDVADAEAGR
jgi:hypothetical protein